MAGVAAIGSLVVVAATLVGGESPSPSTPIASQPTKSAHPVSSQADPPSLDALRSGRVVTLPAGDSSLLDSWGSRKERFVAAAWSLTPAAGAGGGAGRVEVLVEYADARLGLDKGGDRPAKPWDTSIADLLEQSGCGEDGGRCTRRPDGSLLSTFTANEPLSGGGESEVIGAHASLWTEDGLHLSATAYNALGEKATPVTRGRPVLDASQLAAMLQAADLG